MWSALWCCIIVAYLYVHLSFCVVNISPIITESRIKEFYTIQYIFNSSIIFLITSANFRKLLILKCAEKYFRILRRMVFHSTSFESKKKSISFYENISGGQITENMEALKICSSFCSQFLQTIRYFSGMEKNAFRASIC